MHKSKIVPRTIIKIKAYSKFARYEINTKKSITFLYTSDIQLEMYFSRRDFSKSIKNIEMNLNNYALKRTFEKCIANKEDPNKWRNIKFSKMKVISIKMSIFFKMIYIYIQCYHNKNHNRSFQET